VLVIAAAGNTGREGVLYPAAYSDVIAVGSIDPDLKRSSFSTYGPQIAVLAPGRGILTTNRAGSYTALNGTSMAAPHVSGAAAILIARGESLELDGGILSLGDSTVVQPTLVPVNIPPQYQTLYEKAVREGTVPLIVGLDPLINRRRSFRTHRRKPSERRLIKCAARSYLIWMPSARRSKPLRASGRFHSWR
jgi:subtilisin family serine protease